MQDNQSNADDKARFRIGLFSSKDQPLQRFTQQLLDLVFPPRCLHCGRVDFSWCPACTTLLAESPTTPRSLVVDGLDDSMALTPHVGIYREAIQALKYHRALHVAPVLSLKLAKALDEHAWIYDIIIPVPIHTTRFKKRSYNQSKQLSLIISEQLNKPIQENALIRSKNTRAQVGLSHQERLHNIKDAFQANLAQVRGRNVLLVDDVQTTGATLIECANSLRTAGVAKVMAITVSYAERS